MGFMSETPVICQRCRKTFYCGCVITNVCPNCNMADCLHEFQGEEGQKICLKCLKREPAKAENP